jgi:hypothetical protein
MKRTARPAPGTHLFFLGDDGLLFSEPRQELHALNTSAAVIWCLLEDGLDAAEIAVDLRVRLGLSESRAMAFITDALTHWAAKGLLAGTLGPDQPPQPRGWQPCAGLPAYPDPPPAFLAERRYHLLTTVIRMRFTSAAQVALLHPVLAHLETADEGAALCFDILPGVGTTLLYRDGEALDTCADADELVPMIYSALWMTAVLEHGFFLNIHAGVVRGEGGCVLLPAPPGSGKSTLTAALVAAGFTYFSDEVALLDEATLRVSPFPQAVCIKKSGIAAVAALFPEVAGLTLHLRGDGKRVAYFAPPRASLPAPAERGEVRLLVFPRYQEGTFAACEPLTKAVALGRLLTQCTVIRKRLDVAAVRWLVEWIEGIACFDLAYGTTAEGVAAVRRVAEPGLL